MSFRFLFAFLTLLTVPTLDSRAQDAVPTPDVANSKYQIDGVINVPSVYLRSGPGEGYYPTGELAKGTSITVVGIKFDWLKIVPPEGSYSYVGSVFVDKSADGTTGKINRNDVNIRAGSTINAMKTTVQTRLNMGETVQIVGKEDEYLKIKPPAGAYLYINKQFVTIARPAMASNPPAVPAVQQQPAQQQPTQSANSNSTQGKQIAAATDQTAGAIVTSTPTTAPSPVVAKSAPTTAPSQVASATTQPAQVAAAPPPTPEELFTQYENTFADISKQPLDQQPLDDLITKYQSISGNDQLSDELKNVVTIRIATLKGRLDNKAKLVEVHKLEKLAAARQLALQAEQQELTERLKAEQVQVYTAVGELQPSSLQIGGGTLYRLVDPATGRTEIYVRTSDTKITGMMGQFIGVKGEPTTDPQLSLRVIEPSDAEQVDQSKVNSSVMASIIPPSLLARQASSN
jgi:uncharacterized protein YgiM (DUF1202 family)